MTLRSIDEITEYAQNLYDGWAEDGWTVGEMITLVAMLQAWLNAVSVRNALDRLGFDLRAPNKEEPE